MKTIFRISIFIFLILLTFNITKAIEVSTVNSSTSICPGDNNNVIYYIDGNSYSRFLFDEFWTSDDRVISNLKTTVSIWQSDTNLLSGCENSSDWSRLSALSPGNNEHVIALGANCTFNKPTNLNNRTLQFVYNIGYYDIIKGDGIGIGDYNMSYYLNQTEVRNNTPHYKAYTNVGFNNLNIHDNECFNVELRYCGDGILDISEGETCDPEDASRTGFGTVGCSATCEAVNGGGTVYAPAIKITKVDANVSDLDGVAGDDEQTVYIGDNATFLVKVENIGNDNFDSVQIIDSDTTNCEGIFTLNGTYPTTFTNFTIGGLGNNTNDIFEPGETFEYKCTEENITSDHINTIEVKSTGVFSGIEVNSTNTTNIYSRTRPIIPSINGLCGPDDGTILDIAPILPLCNAGTATAVIGTGPWVWTCEGSGFGTDDSCRADYTSDLRDGVCGTAHGSDTTVEPINNLCAVGVVSPFPVNGTGPWNWMCNGINGGNNVSCNTSSTPACVTGLLTPIQLIPLTTNVTNLCPTGEIVGDFAGTVGGNTINYTWTCDGLGGGTCNASYTSGGGGGGGAGGAGGSPTYCGDGDLQRPNDDYDALNPDLSMEECDFGVGPWPAWCSSSTCKISNSTFPGSSNGNITIPGAGTLNFLPIDNVIIGIGMNPYIAHNLVKPSIYNNAGYDFYFSELCVKIDSGNTLAGAEECKNIGFLPNTGNVEFDNFPVFKGVNTFPAGTTYNDNVIKTFLRDGGADSSAVGKLKVRVSKPSIASIGGGTSYLSSSYNGSDISDVADSIVNPGENKNFAGVGVSTDSISSYSNNIDTISGVDSVKTDGDNYNNDFNGVTDNNGTISSINISDIVTFENNKYNGISNVFILKEKNFVVDTLLSLNGPKTYIIENGDLIINENITTNGNIAFVVKGGNIIIKSTVSEIKGTYITMKKNSVGGEFRGDTSTETNQLVVNGSLYGNIDNLVSKRTYIKQNTNGQIDVGTIVSFGSSLFRRPAPLISTFINDYLNSEKIAK